MKGAVKALQDAKMHPERDDTLFLKSPFIKVRSAECPTMMINIKKKIKMIVVRMMYI